MSVIISSEEKESPATASTENGLWVLKCYDPRRQGSGYGFAQQRLQAMLQIEAERHAYSRIAAMTKAEEGEWLKIFPAPPQEATRQITAQCIVGLATLDSIEIIHADIKPANIFLDFSMNVKIWDFGLSRFSNKQGPH
ncbi:hypothetical protein CVT25_003825 [Psilocybe cyanescens]|uniref:Protein kinase domain-containing protein n=1 Tax=Psilocybe cyanescens TaxID=93625 RepID=A0A409XTY2_PSICY|nr:hypothetical protein CVT25_003825 [Psilocybe cyanescens]